MLVASFITLLPQTARAVVYEKEQEAMTAFFGTGAKIERQTFHFSAEQLAEIKKASGTEDALPAAIARYAGIRDGKIVGYAYIDAHRVRTDSEIVFIAVTPDGKIDHIDILSFNEPTDYQPKKGWLEQFQRRPLNDDLNLNKAIRPISGASLSGRAIVNASRKVLATHQVIEKMKK